MKQKVFWLDLAVCSLWLFVALANCSWWSLPTHFLMVVTVVMRIILSFTLYRGEKRSWIPLTVFSALFALLSVEGPVMRTTGDFADLPFVVMGLQEVIPTLMVTQLRIITSRGLSMKCMPQ